VALRAAAAPLAATVTVTDPLPDPLAGDSVTHVAPDEADQAHPTAVVRLTVPAPPAAGTEMVVVDSV
jgi:hypothetical protein